MNKYIVDQSIMYARQQNNHTFELDEEDMARFTGIHLLSGYHSLPRQRLYWSTDEDVVIPLVAKAMTRNNFEGIKKNLHLADNKNLCLSDKAAKVRPLYDMLNTNLKQFGVFKEHISVDEQMLPYFGKHSAKMFMRNKPVKFGYKFWVLASSTGFPFHVLLYTGKDTTTSACDTLGSHVVKQLLSIVTEPSCHTVTFDNFFTSIELLEELKERNFRATGTIRENRLRDCTIVKASSVRKDARGSYFYSGSGNITGCLWKDNKPVYVASNYDGVTPVVLKRRYSRTDKKHIQVDCPKMIDSYNKRMGGVDMVDRFLSEYRPSMRGKKWWFCFYTHAINICTVAAWRIHVELGGQMDQLQFLRYIVRTLLQGQFSRAPMMPRQVIRDIRYDGINHTLIKGPSQGRCKMPGCGTHTWYQCGKCNTRLHQKCFASYHIPPQ